MEILSLLLILVLLILPIFIGRRKFGKSKEFVQKFDKLPGPKKMPYFGNALEFSHLKNEDLILHNYERFLKYGPVSRTWNVNIPVVHLSSAESCEVLLGTMKYLEKSFGYKFIEQWLGDGLLTSKGLKWQKRRKMITPTFHFKILENFMEVMVNKSNILVKCLEKASANGQVFNVFPYITNATLDIICETAMGTNIHAQESPQGDYVSAVYMFSELITNKTRTWWHMIDFIYRMSPMARKWEKALKTLHGFTEGVIKERRQARMRVSQGLPQDDFDSGLGTKNRKAFLDLLLDASDTDPELTDIDIRNEVDTFMFEGHDTTTSGISWTIYLLGLHPEIQEKTYQELQGIFNEENRQINISDLSQMKYLERVIKESMRLYPPVPGFGRFLEEDIVLHGYTVPAGAYAAVHTYPLHRNPESFPNPEVFNPDNFLPENIKNRHPYAYLPFSAGPRNCIGQKFALNEEKTVLASILRKFKIKSMDRREDVKIVSELILRPKAGINIKLETRN